MFGGKKNKDRSAAATGSGSGNTGGSHFSRSQPSVISSEMHILGNIISDGFVDIDGTVDGNVKCHSTTIRERGMVRGDVLADVVHIYGEVLGLVKAKNVTLHATAKVEGTIMHESLTVEDGASVDGQFKRTDRVFIDDEDIQQASSESDDEDMRAQLLNNLRIVQ